MNPAAIALSLLLVSAASTPGPGPRPPERISAALDKGTRFLASVWDGQAYKDPYLEYVYPAEKLESPLAGWPLTYRRIDAYVDLLFLAKALDDPGPIKPQIKAARRLLEPLPAMWGRLGAYNVLHQPDPAGIGLDTYCIVGLLFHDKPMATRVLGQLDGFDWIPPGYYSDQEAFRKPADESWCIRLLLDTGTGAEVTQKLLAEHVRRATEQLAQAARAETRAYLAIHALYMVLDAGKPSLDQDLRRFTDAVCVSGDAADLARDLLLQANLLDACLKGSAGQPAQVPEAASRMAARLVDGQADDGGWPPALGETGPNLRSFTTLRALIALAGYGRALGRA